MTKKNKLILIISICAFVVIAVATILVVALTNRDKWKDVGDKDYTPPPPPPHVPVVTYDITIDRGLKDEYYINQEFDINDVYILYRTFVDGVLDEVESVRCSPAFVKGYPDTPVPDTDTIGYQYFTLNYLGIEYNTGFNVVEYDVKHALQFINSNAYWDNYSMFVLLERDTNGLERDYVDSMREKLADTGSTRGPLVFMQNIEGVIKFGPEISTSGMMGNPDNPSETASLIKNGNLYNGTIWVTDATTVYKVVFEVEYYPATKGVRIDMTINDTTDYGVYISSTEHTYNMVISGVMAEDVIMTYGLEKMYLSTCDAGLYRTIYGRQYDETFGSTGNTVLEYNIDTTEYEMR